MITRFLHASLIVANTENSLTFYCGCLGFCINHQRPDLGFPGAWLQHGDFELHLLEVPNPDPIEDRPVHGGRDRHLAFAVSDFSQLLAQLEKKNIRYTLSKSGRKALFCRDPDGNTLEFVEEKKN